MAMFNKNKEGKYDGGSVMLTVIGPEAYFHGVITVRGSLRIEGEVEGNVHEANEVTVASNGRIKGDVCAEFVTVSGTIEGSIVAAKQLDIKDNGKVVGNIRTAKLLIEEGAIFDGSCTMGDVEAKPDPAVEKAAPEEPATAASDEQGSLPS
ncbi:MAG: polymer-forming cytoskeletal protein [Elusimicrobiota bacterium]